MTPSARVMAGAELVRTHPPAEALRDRAWKAGSDRARASSLGFCRSEQAWKRREKLFERHPVLGLSTLRGTADPRGDRWLERYAEVAPKRVLGALGGRTNDKAYAMRDALFSTGREVVDSVRGQGDPGAWALRERALERWPSTVVHSLLGVEDDRVTATAERCREQAPGDIHMLRRIRGLGERARWPEWARQRNILDGDDD